METAQQITLHDESGLKIQTHRERVMNLLGQASRVVVTNKADLAKVGDLLKIMTSEYKSLEDIRLEETEKPRKYVEWVNERFKQVTAPLVTAIAAVRKKGTDWALEEEKRVKAEADRQRRVLEEQEMAKAAEAQKAKAEAEKRAAEAREAERLAKAAGDKKAAELAALAAQTAATEIEHQQVAIDTHLEVAANVPTVDPTVRGVRGSFSTASVAKKWKASVTDLRLLPEQYVAAIMASEKAMAAIDGAVSKLAIATFQIDHKPIPGLNVRQEGNLNAR